MLRLLHGRGRVAGVRRADGTLHSLEDEEKPRGSWLAESRRDDSFQLLAGMAYGTRAILVGPRHLIEINMERVARAVYSGQSPPPVPRRSDKK